MNKNREFFLPFGIDLRVADEIASIESRLPEALPSFSDPVENGRIAGVVEGVEQLLLSLARGYRFVQYAVRTGDPRLRSQPAIRLIGKLHVWPLSVTQFDRIDC
jgi:hypothetical protein